MAANDGQEDLDKATEAKLNVKSPSDLLEVIRLCESALSKGLDKDNTEFAKKLLASTLLQRGTLITRSIEGTIREGASDPNLANQRNVALSDLDRAVKLDPDQAETYFRIAELNCLPGGNEKRAMEALDKSIALNKDDPVLKAQALLVRAELQKDPQKRLADADEAVRAAPGSAKALRFRGDLLANAGQSAKALADFDAVLKIEPRDWQTMADKALVFARIKKFDEARAAIRKAREMAPKEVEALWKAVQVVVLLKHAQIELAAGDYQAAVGVCTEANRLEPADVRPLIPRGGVPTNSTRARRPWRISTEHGNSSRTPVR